MPDTHVVQARRGARFTCLLTRRGIGIDCLLLSSRVDAVPAREGYRFVGDLDGLTFGLFTLAGLHALRGPR